MRTPADVQEREHGLTVLDLPARTCAGDGSTRWHHTWQPPASALSALGRHGATPVRCVTVAVVILVYRYGHRCRVSGTLAGGDARADLARLLRDGEDLPLAAMLRPAHDRDVVAADGGSDPAGGDDAPIVAVDTGDAGDAADLRFAVAGDGTVRVEHTAAYPGATVEGICRHLDTLLASAAASPGSTVAALDIMDDAEQRRTLAAGWADPKAYPPVTLHQLFALQAWRTPGAVALEEDTRSCTYAELERMSTSGAWALHGMGVAAGDLVLLQGGRRIELFAAVLAVLKAGAAMVYLDPRLPSSWREAIATASGASHLVGEGPAHAGFTGRSCGIDELVTGGGASSPTELTTPPAVVGPDDPAYVIYTSGSSGRPKGVVRSHRANVSRIFLEQACYPQGAADRHLLKSAISAREFLWPLAFGAAAVIARPGGEADDRYLLDLVRHHRISVISVVPSLLKQMLHRAEFARCGALRHVFVGGESCTPDLEDAVREAGCEVHVTYTLSEAAYVTQRSDPTPPAPPVRARTHADELAVGWPVDMQALVVDGAGRLLPLGVVGQIVTGGPGLASGYVGDTEETSRRFVENRYGFGWPRLFVTGDLGRWRPDGQLAYVGRADQQVKVAGNRVEPTIIEAELRRDPDVHDAAVVGHVDARTNTRLVAFIVPADRQPPWERLRARCAGALPEYMVPAYPVFVDRLPTLLSGKVDRRRLAPPPRGRPDLDTPFAPPADPVQERVAAIWEEVLALHGPGVDDRFGEVGGDSLRLLVLRAALESAFDRDLEVADLVDRPTIRAQATWLAGEEPREPAGRRRTPGDRARLAARRRGGRP